MPELPEVETIRRDLASAILKKKIVELKLNDSKVLKNDRSFFIESLLKRSVVNISRRGKLLIFEISRKKGENDINYLLTHLKMTGQLILINKNEKIVGGHSENNDSFEKAVGGSLPNKHTRAEIVFAGGARLFFNDLRRFGYLQIVSQPELLKIKSENYGPEPLSSELSIKYFSKMLNKRTSSIKALLLNQKLIAGLGNIYVDEALFLAGIRPMREGGSLSLAEKKKLLSSINNVIEKAIENRGTTFSNYLDSSGRKGNFSRLLNVYGRKGKPCNKCGNAIEKIKLAGRGTHFCLKCQS